MRGMTATPSTASTRGTSASPMMQQYHDAKSACGDALLLFRMGDFYELFFDDAQTASRVLGLTLTSREKGENATPMAGFPHHQLENYLAKLIAAGYRAAVCDQVEDPRHAKGIVKREVTRVVTAGTLTDDALLDPRHSNYLAAVAFESRRHGQKRGQAHFASSTLDGESASTARQSVSVPVARPLPNERVGIAWAELSTGRFCAAVFPMVELADQLARIGPAECLVSESAPPIPQPPSEKISVTQRPPWCFGHNTAAEALSRQFGVSSLEGYGFGDDDDPAVCAAGAILEYLRETQKSSLDHIDRLTPFQPGGVVEIDQSTRRNLELTMALRDGRRDGTLLAVIDRTVTPMGSRLLAEWLSAPLATMAPLVARHDAVAELVGDVPLVREVRELLDEVHDLERLLARVATERASPRDLKSIAGTLGLLPKLKAKLTARKSNLLAECEGQIDLCPELRSRLDAALGDTCPLSARDGGFIRDGYSADLDSLRELAAGGKQWIANYQAEESARSGISNLRVGYNKVFGYYIELTNAQRQKAPAHYIRKQTLKNAERYVTPELKEYEEKILSADERAKELEYDLFVELRKLVQQSAARLMSTAAAVARIDVLSALADLARQRGYTRPELVEESVLRIEDGRHPVLDALATPGTFVPNDTRLGGDEGNILLITGPNMAGKSTYIRQVALLTLMAQIGSFVPARSATIGIADRIFARVGASDELARGQSTFMVEMIEAARILNTATPRSLVILDELGRGTSTYDGISLAWAIVEHLHDSVSCRTLFATHYHELTDLESSLSGVRNLNVSVREWDDQVVFLHKIVAGAADKSYGIHVARLAGVPRQVNERAKQILAHLESEHLDEEGRPRLASAGRRRRRGDLQLTLLAPSEHPLLDEIRAVDIESMTPLDALRSVDQWRRQLNERQ